MQSTLVIFMFIFIQCADKNTRFHYNRACINDMSGSSGRYVLHISTKGHVSVCTFCTVNIHKGSLSRPQFSCDPNLLRSCGLLFGKDGQAMYFLAMPNLWLALQLSDCVPSGLYCFVHSGASSRHVRAKKWPAGLALIAACFFYLKAFSLPFFCWFRLKDMALP